MTEQPIRIAIVGLGERALGTWVPLLDAMDDFEIVGICDSRPARIAAAATRWPRLAAAKVYDAYGDVLADPSVDAIALTVRTPDQGALAAAALESGKHVHAEVPAAHSIEDCWRIVLAAERSESVYMLAEQTRYWGFIQEWRRMREAGELGHITYVEGQYFHYLVDDKFMDPESGDQVPLARAGEAGVVHTWQHDMPPIHYLPHELSPMLSVIGDRVEVVVGMSTGERSHAHPELTQSDMQVALMQTAQGAILRMATSFVQPHPEDNWHWYQVIGTKGRVEFSRTSRDRPKLWLADRQMHELSDVDWRFERTDAPAGARGSGHGDADYYAHRAFADAVRGRPGMDVYTAIETAAPAIVAAESIARASIPLRVPDFRPGPHRRAGEAPRDADSAAQPVAG